MSFLEQLNRPALTLSTPGPKRARKVASLRAKEEMLDAILNVVARYYRTDSRAMLTLKRGPKDVRWARMVAMTLMSELGGVSTLDVARYFGRLNYTCVYCARDTVEELVSVYATLQEDLRILTVAVKMAVCRS